MSTARILTMSVVWVLISTPSISAQDLSSYRGYQLGTSLGAVAEQAGLTPEGQVLHQRPQLIQELMWLPPRALSSSPQQESVRKVVFTFYNGQLFRMVVSYDRDRTQGLTNVDLVEALSTTYGVATLPPPEVASSSFQVSDHNDKVVARWEDPQYSLTLFRSSYPSAFGLLVSSKPLDALAQTATVEAIRLDEEEAPQRESARQQKQAEENRAKLDKARGVNKLTFRP
ncbi:MAG: hypothetical protein GEV06_27310 [Luteitalea sp.]|nr:hypothetical protein [Luteitalea sp.]